MADLVGEAAQSLEVSTRSTGSGEMTPRRVSATKQKRDSQSRLDSATQTLASPPKATTSSMRKSFVDDVGVSYALRIDKVLDCGKTEVFGLRYSESGRYLVAALGDGTLQAINTSDGSLLPKQAQAGPNEGKDGEPTPKRHPMATAQAQHLLDVNGVSPLGRLPCTCLDFRPNPDGTRTANVLAAGRADGEMELWHVPSNKTLHTTQVYRSSESEERVQLLSLAWARDASQMAVGGDDGIVRLLDGETLEEAGQLKAGRGRGSISGGGNPGHSSRVFSVKYFPEGGGASQLASAGWDNCVHLWDVRQRASTLTIFGPHVCGDALDLSDDGQDLLTGSWREEDQLQIWDRRTGKLRETIKWGAQMAADGGSVSCRLYAACFSHTNERAASGMAADSRFIAAGGGDGVSECKVFHHHKSNALIGSVLGLQGGVMSLQFHPEGGQSLAIGSGGGTVHIVDIVERDPDTAAGGMLMA